MKIDGLCEEFAHWSDALEEFRARRERQLGELVVRSGQDLQFVASRVKTAASLRQKLGRPDKTYTRLWDVTDLVGIRVVVAFEESVDVVAREIERHWKVDLAHSADKRRYTDHGRFGYRSLHYVCAADESDGLPSAFRFEVQLRTVLQHAWAEVEHDLGYKATQSVPDVIRRRFSRIASLLELADQEFSSIRADLQRYEREVREGVMDPARSIPIDVVSLAELVRSAPLEAFDERLAGLLNVPLADRAYFPQYLVTLLHHAGLLTTTAVHDALARHGDRALALVPAYIRFAAETWSLDVTALAAIERGYGLFFLAHVVLLQRDDLHVNKVGRLAQVYRVLDHPEDEREAQRIAGLLSAALLPLIDA